MQMVESISQHNPEQTEPYQLATHYAELLRREFTDYLDNEQFVQLCHNIENSVNADELERNFQPLLTFARENSFDSRLESLIWGSALPR